MEMLDQREQVLLAVRTDRQLLDHRRLAVFVGAEDEAVYLVRPRAEGHHGTESAKGLTLEDEEKAR